MARIFHIITGLAAAALLAGCAAPTLNKYMGRPILDPMLDFGKPSAVFDLPDGQRAYQWEVEKEAQRARPTPMIGVGIGVGRGRWSHVTTIGPSYETYLKKCRYTLIAAQRGADWIVTDQRNPAPGCG